MSPGRQGGTVQQPSAPFALSFVLSSPDGNSTIQWTWNTTNPTSFAVQKSTNGVSGWSVVGTYAGTYRSLDSLQAAYYRVLVVGGQFDGTYSNVVGLSQS